MPAILLVEQSQPLTTLKNLHEKKTLERYQAVKQTQESKALAVTSELINHPPQLLTALIELEMTEMSTHTEKQFKPVLCYKALQDSHLNI